MKILFFVLVTFFSIVLSGRVSCNAESTVLDIVHTVTNCDNLYLCQYGCRSPFTGLNCGNKLKRVPKTIDVEMNDAAREIYEAACITYRNTNQKISDIMEDYEIEIEQSIKRGNKDENIENFNKIINNSEFKTFWKSFKSLCKKEINDLNLVQRARKMFLAHTWKNAFLKSTVHKMYTENSSPFFTGMIDKLIRWASGRFSPPCQCLDIMKLVQNGKTPMGTELGKFKSLKSKLDLWKSQIKELCHQKYPECVPK